MERKRIGGWSRPPHRWIGMTIQLLLPLILGACSSLSTIAEVDKSLQLIRTTIKESLPGGIRKTSENGREFDSNYFAPKGPFDVDGSSGNFRETAHVQLLGASRPYNITVEILIEKRDGRSYEVIGRDNVRTKELVRRIQTGLSNRRDDRNMIDDFKPF